MIKAGITPERITPGQPQENAGHERLHLTLVQDTADPPAAPGAEQRLISRQELAIAEEILAELKPEQRRVLLLRHLDGCSHRRIGAETGYSAEQVRSYLQNARRNFALRWRQRTGGGGGDDA